jgi:hypothetical protein
MKKILAIVTISFILVSCSKDASNASGSNTITATINGVTDTFKINTVDTLGTLYGFYERGVEGSSDTSASANRIGILIVSATPPTTGSYSENGILKESRLIIQGGIGDYSNNSSVANPLVVNVTSISPTAIHGTFYGNIFQSPTDSLVISNGKFDFNK